MSNKTLDQYDAMLAQCRDIFEKKMKDYGPSWHVLRPSSLTDQIYIKANRIRSIEETGVTKIDEGVYSEYIGIINYSLIAQIQLEFGVSDTPPDSVFILNKYSDYAQKAKDLMKDKNHDYGEAWRKMRVSSMTDLILMKIQRVKQIEDNKGNTIISEGLDANYYDIMNYAIFAMIKIHYKE
ncbi:MAG: DUF1599 domain-containing protein [Bacteroidales bacterium]